MDYEEIKKLHEEYYTVFGKLPPVSPDDDFYSPEKIEEIRAAISMGKPL